MKTKTHVPCALLVLFALLPLLSLSARAQALVATERLVWIGDAPPADHETLALFEALRSAARGRFPESLVSLEQFLTNYPNSAWGPSLESQLGKVYRDCGRDTSALQHWEAAWLATREFPSGTGKRVADFTLAHWTRLLASLGRYQALVDIRQQTKGRVLDHGPLSQMWARTQEAITQMYLRPGNSYRCGSFALHGAAVALGVRYDAKALLSIPSPEGGFTMQALNDLSSRLGLNVVAVRREGTAAIPVPSVIHWSQNHYAAIVKRQGRLFKVVDPTFVRPRYMTAETINAEPVANLWSPAARFRRDSACFLRSKPPLSTGADSQTSLAMSMISLVFRQMKNAPIAFRAAGPRQWPLRQRFFRRWGVWRRRLQWLRFGSDRHARLARF